MNFKIISNIEIERSGRNRKATFFVQPNGTKLKIKRYLVSKSIQQLLFDLEKEYKKTLYVDDYSYNFTLRKDEIIPRPEKRPADIPCSIQNCKNISTLYHLEKPMCTTHFMEHDKTLPVVRSIPKIFRNYFCHCGSGRKYKFCCELKISVNPGRQYYTPRNI